MSDSPHDYGWHRDFKMCNRCKSMRPLRRLKPASSDSAAPMVCGDADAEWCWQAAMVAKHGAAK